MTARHTFLLETAPILVELFLLLLGRDVQANRGYFVAHPRVLRPGTEHIAVTIFDPTEPILVQVRLTLRNGMVSSAERSIFGKGILRLEIPEFVRGRATLDICGNCLTASTGYHFRNSTDVLVSPKSSSVFIQIDRPVYKPGQDVLINFIITGPDLKPKDQDVFAYIEDPKGSRMVQWRELDKQCCGLRNATFPLSDQPVLGEWKIFAVLKNQVYNKTFHVEKYVLPKFEVLIHPPKFIVDINRCRPASIEARYTYGKPVRGKVSINMKLVGIGYYDNYLGNNQFIFKDINGVANFNICVSAMVSSALFPYFKGAIDIEASVTSSDGHVFTAQDDSCLVKRQPIGVEFTKDTVKHFKPGLPFEGRLSVYFPDDSPADQVTVKLQAESNYKSFYEADLISENGLISFKVDKIPEDLSLIWISAKITKWRGHYPGGTYNPVYHSARSWYSPSGCYIQTKLLNSKLKVGDHAVVGILSSCPCNVSLYYHLMSRGDLVYSGVKEPSHDDVTNVALNDTLLCKTAITFTTTHNMAPATQLVVYFLRDDNETVADHLPLEVEPMYENEVSFQFSSNHTSPGSKLTMTVSAKPGSCVCVGSVDRSIQLMYPAYELNTQQVFEEVDTFNILEPQRPETWWTTHRRRRTVSYMGSQTADSYQAFKASGLHVMTDRAQLRFHPVRSHHRSSVHQYQAATVDQGGARSSRNIKRAYFPETWLWNCFNISSTRKQEQFRVHLPDSITTWSTQAFALSETHGFGLSQQSSLVSIKQFFVDVTLPYSVIRGEQVRLPVSVYNYQDICVQVSLTVTLPEGAQIVDSEVRLHSEILCMQERETQTIYLEVEFIGLGKAKILASADVHTAFGCCADDVIGDAIIATDRISRSLIVQPEGIPRAYTYSVFFCPNERIHLSTPNRYEFQFLRRPPTMDFLTFMCKASNDARIALAPTKSSHYLYEIVIGGWSNTQTWLSTEKNGDMIEATVTNDILDRNEFRAFWISWKGGLIQVGYGESPSNESMILQWLDEEPMLVNYIGFSTGFGSTGEFRIWKKKGNSEMFIEAFTLSLPLNFIPGSEKAKAVMLADVMGPTLSNLQRLIRLPFGCGEQNMIHFAPNIYVMSYLERTTQLTPEIKREATGFLVQGYQRQLTYRRRDGSYSAFGESDTSGSMWLTAFVLKSFAQSQAYIYIDPRELSMTKNWIIAQQLQDGSFPPLGTVLNKDIQGGIQGMVSLTAYVVVALLETGLNSDKERQSVERGQRFLESNLGAIQDSYSAALTAYALTLRESHMATEAVRILTSKEIYSDGMRYWSLNGQPHEVLPHYNVMGNLEQTVTSAEIEMTAYALLTYTTKRDIAYSLPIVKWLTKQRNSLGGFSSTQDTCVALQALSEYAALSYVRDVNLTISLGYVDQGESVEKVYHINNQNSKVQQSVEIPALSQNLFLRSTGEGCGLLQVDVKYNIPDPNRNPAFRLNVDLVRPISEQTERGKRDTSNQRRKARISIKTCTRWLHAGSSNMAVIEVDLVSGFTAVRESLEQLLLNRHAKVKRYELEGWKVILYFDEIPSQCMTCVSFLAEQEFLVMKLHPVPVKVYDYYEPHYEAIQMYNVTSEIPAACVGEHCNEVGGAASQDSPMNWLPRSLNLCNMVNGDCLFLTDQIMCSCERTCSYGGPPVCGSDKIRYNNLCHMEVTACQKDENIKVQPLENCGVTPTEAVLRNEVGDQTSVSEASPTDDDISSQTDHGESESVHSDISLAFSAPDLPNMEPFDPDLEMDDPSVVLEDEGYVTDEMWQLETTRSKATPELEESFGSQSLFETWPEESTLLTTEGNNNQQSEETFTVTEASVVDTGRRNATDQEVKGVKDGNVSSPESITEQYLTSSSSSMGEETEATDKWTVGHRQVDVSGTFGMDTLDQLTTEKMEHESDGLDDNIRSTLAVENTTMSMRNATSETDSEQDEQTERHTETGRDKAMGGMAVTGEDMTTILYMTEIEEIENQDEELPNEEIVEDLAGELSSDKKQRGWIYRPAVPLPDVLQHGMKSWKNEEQQHDKD